MTTREITLKEITRKSWSLTPISIGLVGLSAWAAHEKNMPLIYVVLGLTAAFAIYGVAVGIWVGQKIGQIR